MMTNTTKRRKMSLLRSMTTAKKLQPPLRFLLPRSNLRFSRPNRVVT